MKPVSRSRFGALAAVLLLSACASFDGRGLVPGQSRLAEVEETMGRAAERRTLPGGDTALYYPRLPEGRKTYVAIVSPEGTLRRIEQRLDYPYIRKIVPNETSAKQVRELLGPPARTAHMPRIDREVWEYPWLNAEDRRILWVQFSDDGVVREVIEMHDYESDPPSGSDNGGKD